MIRALLSIIGVCLHRNISWPMTKGGVTTVQCHDCHTRQPYDLMEMRVGESRQAAPERTVEA